MERPFERVYTVFEYWDGPRAGFADFDGVPHAYQSIFRQDLDDWDPDGRFELSPVSAEVLQLALEDREIWRRWEQAYQAELTTLSTHPALPEDRARHQQIRPAVELSMQIDPAHRRVAIGDFRRYGSSHPGRKPLDEAWHVRWSPVE